jgi:hypothetical protein
MEGAILIWFAIGAGIAAGAFLMARSAVEIAVVAYGVLEKRLDPKVATRQTVVLTLAIVFAVIATAVIAGYAILSIFASLIQNGTFE